jgi:hypothetical protein
MMVADIPGITSEQTRNVLDGLRIMLTSFGWVWRPYEMLQFSFHFPNETLLFRASPSFLLLKIPWRLRGMGTSFINTYSLMMVTGRENMVDPCSFSQVW